MPASGKLEVIYTQPRQCPSSSSLHKGSSAGMSHLANLLHLFWCTDPFACYLHPAPDTVLVDTTNLVNMANGCDISQELLLPGNI